MCAHHHRLRVRLRLAHLLAPNSNNLGNSNAINALSFSHDGEFIAIANAGSYIDIVSVCTEACSRGTEILHTSVQRKQVCRCIVSLLLGPRLRWHGTLQNMLLRTADKRRPGKAALPRQLGLVCLGRECRLPSSTNSSRSFYGYRGPNLNLTLR